MVQMNLSTFLKAVFSLMGSYILTFYNGYVVPNWALIILCILFIFVDSISALRLSKRLKTEGKSSGKFKSEKATNILVDIVLAFALILLAFAVQKHVFVMFDSIYLPNWAALFFIMKELWSILENESSSKNKKWAIILQKIMVDKSERHFDIDLSILKKEIEDKEKDIKENINEVKS